MANGEEAEDALSVEEREALEIAGQVASKSPIQQDIVPEKGSKGVMKVEDANHMAIGASATEVIHEVCNN